MQEKKSIFLTIIGVLTLLIATVGASFAYFMAGGSIGTEADVRVGTSNQDILTFEVGSDINFEVNQTTFAQNAGNAVGSTIAKAILITGNEENELRASYNLYLDITQNELNYTNGENYPELLLKVTNQDGTELTSINGLDYKEVTDGKNNVVKGFDITTKTGLITILSNQEIVAKPSKTDTWNIEVIFVNYDFNQLVNVGKSLSAGLQITKGDYEINEAKLCNGKTLSECIKLQYRTQGESGIYLHNGTIKSGDTVIDAGDGSYRYAGSNPNNYVCFGSDEAICPSDNLYRIIGVFGENVKLIKADFATSDALGEDGAFYDYATMYIGTTYKGSLSQISRYYWASSDNSNSIWSESNLNTINLNTNYILYLNNQNSKWANMIVESSWQIGGNIYANIETIPMYSAYQNEIVSPKVNTITKNKIGLMYVSDYGYAASPTYWPTSLGDYNSSNYSVAVNENWMYSGVNEWTITPNTDYSSSVFVISNMGNVNYNYVNISYNGVRPVFYLNSNVKYVGDGNGSYNSPYYVE